VSDYILIIITIISARQHIMQSALLCYYAIALPSARMAVRPFVRHTDGSVKND